MRNRAAGTLSALGVLVLASTAAAAEMNPRFAPLAPLLGKTWRGVMSPPGAAKPVVDVQRFELALNGQAVRNRHSVYTTGTMSVEDGAIVFHEIVKGSAGGVTEVKATSRLLPDGRLHVKSRYLKNGQWEDGRETYYVEDPQAVVRFKE